MSELTIVVFIIFAIFVVGIFYFNRLSNDAAVLRAENQTIRSENNALRKQVDLLLDLLDTFWSREKELTQSPVRERSLDEVLSVLHSLRRIGGIEISGSDVHVGGDLTGGDHSNNSTPKGV